MGSSMLEVVKVTTTLDEVGGGVLGGALKKVEVLKTLSLNTITIEDPFDVYFSESTFN